MQILLLNFVTKKQKNVKILAYVKKKQYFCSRKRFERKLLLINNKKRHMIYSKEVQEMCVVAKGPKHGPAPIPEEGKWVKATEIKDISGMTHGIGWCAPSKRHS